MREMDDEEWQALDTPGKDHLVGWMGQVDGEWRWWGRVPLETRELISDQK